ncbi:MAG TPA: succinate dehydrogenase cytochrome b subunit [Gemmatimonadaceae bacterium]|nr:succinate dehydrogenase cytochrome b subunit [Gemmatimonadaceae bacterium]
MSSGGGSALSSPPASRPVAAPPRRRTVVGRGRAFWGSTIGKKIVMAATGWIMIAFVIVHMIGNLQIFESAVRLNAYSAFLHHTIGELLWLVRIILLVSVVLHIVAAVQLTQMDLAARPVPYARKQRQAATIASSTMRWGGLAILLFVIFHILHITTGTIHPERFVPGDVYGNLVGSFTIWWVTLIYVLAMIALGLHIFHGAWSSTRTLGLNQPASDPFHRPIATLIAVVVWAGFTLVPLAIFFGWVR